MNTLRHVRVPALAVLLLPLPCLAQQASSPQDVAACASISTDQLRLACFDAAVAGQRSPSAIEQADAAAADGKQRIREEKAAGNDTGEHGGDLYAHDSARSALANAGRGSLLDSRWELAQDSKLGTFGLRAYKPVYLLPAFWTGCAEHGISPSMVVKQLCHGPAKHFLLDHRKGTLNVGADADIVIVKPETYKFDPSSSLAAVQWSSFEGREFTVRVDTTFVRGQLAWDGKKIRNQAGDGAFIRPHKGGQAAGVAA